MKLYKILRIKSAFKNMSSKAQKMILIGVGLFGLVIVSSTIILAYFAIQIGTSLVHTASQYNLDLNSPIEKTPEDIVNSITQKMDSAVQSAIPIGCIQAIQSTFDENKFWQTPISQSLDNLKSSCLGWNQSNSSDQKKEI